MVAAFDADRAAAFGAALEAVRGLDFAAAFEAVRGIDFAAAFEAVRGLDFAAAFVLRGFAAVSLGFVSFALDCGFAALGFDRVPEPCFAPVPGPRRDWPLPAVVRALAPLARVVPVDWRELLLFDPFDAAADFDFVDFDAFD